MRGEEKHHEFRVMAEHFHGGDGTLHMGTNGTTGAKLKLHGRFSTGARLCCAGEVLMELCCRLGVVYVVKKMEKKVGRKSLYTSLAGVVSSEFGILGSKPILSKHISTRLVWLARPLL